jgi:hypothetical protein
VSIRDQVERLKYLALANAELKRLSARLALLERDVADTERLFSQPFQRGRAILAQTRAQIARERASLEGGANVQRA